MEFLFGVTGVSGLSFKFCSVECEQRNIKKTVENLEQRIRACPHCLSKNAEMFKNSRQFKNTTNDGQVTFNLPNRSIKSSRRGSEIQKSPSEITLHPEKLRKTQQTENLTQCGKPGKVTVNGFFNFIREVRQEMCGERKQKVIVAAAARRWKHMTISEKCKYQRRALEKQQ